jgi:hypothetical protein
VVIPTAVLAAISSERIVAAARRYAPIGIARVFSVSVPTVVAHAFIFAALSFGVGRVLALVLM